MKYEYDFIRVQNNLYFFETFNSIIYQIKFKPTPYLFDTIKIDKNSIFEFVIEVYENNTGKKPAFDINVGKTVSLIFKDFYSYNYKNICIYICDSSDNKQDIRKRKFDEWFFKYQTEEFIKIDKVINDKNNVLFPISLIIHKENPKFIEIAVAFRDLGSSQKPI